MADVIVFWRIVPIDDGYHYLYKDKGGHHLRRKIDGLPDNDLLLFNTKEQAIAYIKTNFHPLTHKAEWIVIDQSVLSKWKREKGIVPNNDCGECPVWLADKGVEHCAECPLRKEYLARFQ